MLYLVYSHSVALLFKGMTIINSNRSIDHGAVLLSNTKISSEYIDRFKVNMLIHTVVANEMNDILLVHAYKIERIQPISPMDRVSLPSCYSEISSDWED